MNAKKLLRCLENLYLRRCVRNLKVYSLLSKRGRRNETVNKDKGKGNEKEKENGVEPRSVSALAKVT